MNLTKKIVSHDGTTIRYRVVRKSKSFIVFVHGLTSNHEPWMSQAQFFEKKGYSTILFDLRGHGQSSMPRGNNSFTMQAFARDINEILKAENVNKAVLIGGCFGGMIIQEFYKLFPKKTRGLIMISTTYKDPYRHHELSEALKGILIPLLKGTYAILLGLIRITNFGSIRYPLPNWNRYKNYSERKIMFLNTLVYTNPKTVISCQKTMMDFNSEKMLRSARIPMYIIAGKKDTIFAQTIPYEMNLLSPHAEIKIFPTGHLLLNGEYKNELHAEILRFIKSL